MRYAIILAAALLMGGCAFHTAERVWSGANLAVTVIDEATEDN